MDERRGEEQSLPEIHFVSGFLGSGKTTAIVNLCKVLVERGMRTAVVTNDQGRYQVDQAFVESARIPSTAVAEGCFCCRYDDFEEKVLSLSRESRPEVIFAESVGSCADVIATVVKPFRNFRGEHSPPGSLSAFTDIRMLEARLEDRDKLPFSDEVIYIFDKQIEEAELLVVNKSDLADEGRISSLRDDLTRRYPGKEILFICAFDEDDVLRWWTRISTRAAAPSLSLESMDYRIYGKGERRLAWLDARSLLSPSAEGTSPGAGGQQAAAGERGEDSTAAEAGRNDEDGRAVIADLIFGLVSRLLDQGAAVGHIKVAVTDAQGNGAKASVTGMDSFSGQRGPSMPSATVEGLLAQLPERLPLPASLLVNARVMTDTATLGRCYGEAVESVEREHAVVLSEREEDLFLPGYPVPQQRLE